MAQVRIPMFGGPRSPAPVSAVAPCSAPGDYLEAVRRAGAVPLVLDPERDTPSAVVEATESAEHRLCVDMQWHPENLVRAGRFAPLFEELARHAAWS